MASFSVEDFVGNGVLKSFLPKLLNEGWDNVPTIKVMSSEDMDAMNMTRQQEDALEIRSYLHDCDLVGYGDKLECSGKSIQEISALNAADLSSQFDMKRGHIARFMYKTGTINKNDLRSSNSVKVQRINSTFNLGINNDGHIYKGIVAAGPAEARACGCVKAPSISETVAPYSEVENISILKLTPEYKIKMELLVKIKTPPMKVSELWREKPAVILCIRRPG